MNQKPYGKSNKDRIKLLRQQDITTNPLLWQQTSHYVNRSSFLCAETPESFLVRWNTTSGKILEKEVSKRYLEVELGSYCFNKEDYRWCAASNIVDDDRVPSCSIQIKNSSSS